MKLGEKLVILRKKNSISQDELASAVRVSRQSVYKWESGKSAPDADNLVALKHTFGISIDDLLDENFVIELPQKKKRRKRISAEEREKIQAQVMAEEGVAAPVAKEEPKVEPVKVEVPVVKEAPKAKPAKVEAPVVKEAPKAEPVKVEAPVAKEEPKAEPVKVEAPVVKEEPKAEPAKVEAPVVKEEPKAEAPKAEKKPASKKKTSKDDDFDADEYFNLLRDRKKGSFFDRLFGSKK